MFLHLLKADRKFFPPLHRLFEEAAPGRNVWVAVGEPDVGFDLPAGVHLATSREDVQEIVRGVDPLDGVVLNGLSFAQAGGLLQGLPSRVSVAWYVWGFEAYMQWDTLKRGALLPETERLVRELERGTSRVRRVARSARLRMSRAELTATRVVGRLDFCVTPIREEYELYLAAGLPRGTAYHRGLVGCLEDYVAKDSAPRSSTELARDDIQLGNSASPWNNHVDALSLIAASPGAGTVVVPLGYGDRRYAAMVAERGEELLGDRFRALMGFLPPEEYLETVESCEHVVMDHLRQQALGTIFAALWRGACLHMNATTAYAGLERMGFEIRLIPAPGAPLRLKPLSPSAVSRHQELLEERFARVRVLDDTRVLLDKMTELTASRRRVADRRST